MPTEPRKVLGKIDCRICGSEAVLREAVTTLAYYTCDNCVSQHFARSRPSDAKLRALLKSTAPPTPTPEKKPAQEPPRETKPAAKPGVTDKQPAAAGRRGIFGAR